MRASSDRLRRLLRARGARDYQPAAEVLPVGEALPPRPRQVNRLLEKLGRAKCPIIGAGRGVIESRAVQPMVVLAPSCAP